MIKIFKYLIKLEAAIHGCTIKKLFWRVLRVSLIKTLLYFKYWLTSVPKQVVKSTKKIRKKERNRKKQNTHNKMK